jgi:hypothetical protein
MKGRFSTIRGSIFVSGSLDHSTWFHVYRDFLPFLAINAKKSSIYDIKRHLWGESLSDIRNQYSNYQINSEMCVVSTILIHSMIYVSLC